MSFIQRVLAVDLLKESPEVENFNAAPPKRELSNELRLMDAAEKAGIKLSATMRTKAKMHSAPERKKAILKAFETFKTEFKAPAELEGKLAKRFLDGFTTSYFDEPA